jgi:hypothetical protein
VNSPQQQPAQAQPQGDQVIVLPLATVQRIGEIAMDAPTRFGGPIIELLKQGQLGNLGDKPAP